MEHSSSPSYQVVYQYQPHPFDDFVPVGIFTNIKDADTFNATLTGHAHAVAARTHEELCVECARHYLGNLFKPVQRLSECFTADSARAAAGGYGI